MRKGFWSKKETPLVSADQSRGRTGCCLALRGFGSRAGETVGSGSGVAEGGEVEVRTPDEEAET